MEGDFEGRPLPGDGDVCSQRQDQDPVFDPGARKGDHPGEISLPVRGEDRGRQIHLQLYPFIDAQERKAGADNIQINAAYPVLRGQTDAKFEFSLEVTNKGDMERTFNLAATGPEKWEINFKPAYEQKQISSIRVKEGPSQTVAVEVTPAQNAASGEYPILVRIGSGDSKAEVKLMVNLTGTYRLDAGTPNGILRWRPWPASPLLSRFS